MLFNSLFINVAIAQILVFCSDLYIPQEPKLKKSDLPVLVAHEVYSQRTKPVPRYVILAMQKWSFLLFLILLDN